MGQPLTQVYFMQVVNPTLFTPLAAQIEQFFRETAGDWHSQRRYYTLSSGDTQEVESLLTVQFLEQGAPELLHLAGLHDLDDPASVSCGTQVTWESTYTNQNRKPATGSTIFGVCGDLLLRDRGFATPKPITALYTCPNQQILCLRTEYNGSSFEEELKLIGTQYRTRQSIISRAGQEIMIGQYLETRI
jgi:hypothetical protein